MKLKGARPKDMLVLKLHEPATPAHVARAGRLFADALVALGVSDAGVTFVIENDHLLGTVRTRTPAGKAGVQSIIDLVSKPVGALGEPAGPERIALAAVLGKYAREEHRAKPELWRATAKGGRLCTLDEGFAAIMEVLANTPPSGAHRVHGTTYVHTKILRIGRVDERHAPRIRIMVDGRPLDVPLAEALATGPFYDAAKNEQVVRVRLRASWVHLAGDRPELREAVVIALDDTKGPATGARIVEMARAQRVISGDDDLPAVLSSIDRDGDQGDND